jgi:hypothetical protein
MRVGGANRRGHILLRSGDRAGECRASVGVVVGGRCVWRRGVGNWVGIKNQRQYNRRACTLRRTRWCPRTKWQEAQCMIL